MDSTRAQISASGETLNLSARAKQDLKTIASILIQTETEPLPIMRLRVRAAERSVKVFSDASRAITENASLGLYIPSEGSERPLVASLAFPISFLRKKDDEDKKAYYKSLMLESLAYLAVLCKDPRRFEGQDAMFFIDNIATVIRLEKGYSSRQVGD